MTRHVFTNQGVANAWHNRSPSHGRSKNGNFWFNGACLFSYGQHYMVARHVRALDGKRVVLFNANGSTITTETKHKNAAFKACDYRPDFTIPFVSEYVPHDHSDYADWANSCQQWYREEYKQAREKQLRARVHGDLHKMRAERIACESKRFERCFGAAYVINWNPLN